MQLLSELVNCSSFCIAVMYSLGIILIMVLDGSVFADLTQVSYLKSTESISLLGRLESTPTLFSLAITGVRGGGGGDRGVHIMSLLAHKKPNGRFYIRSVQKSTPIASNTEKPASIGDSSE